MFFKLNNIIFFTCKWNPSHWCSKKMFGKAICIGKTPKGYMNNESMKSWFEKKLILYIDEELFKIANNNIPAQFNIWWVKRPLW